MLAMCGDSLHPLVGAFAILMTPLWFLALSGNAATRFLGCSSLLLQRSERIEVPHAVDRRLLNFRAGGNFDKKLLVDRLYELGMK
jgi:hypothetical protein